MSLALRADTQKKKGLSDREAALSRDEHGANSISGGKKRGFMSRYLEGFSDPIIRVLLIALGINILMLFRGASVAEPLGIAAAVMIATMVSTISEHRSESTFMRLQEEASRVSCAIWRDGALCELPADEVVVGDLICLQAGDRIPADAVIVSGSVEVDQSALNGEAKEAKKYPGRRPIFNDGIDFLCRQALFRGTVVTRGECECEAVRVGNGTFYGKLAREVQVETRKSPLKLRLGRLADIISKLGYTGAGLVAFAHIFRSFVIEPGFSMSGTLALLHNPGVALAELLKAVTYAVIVIVVSVPEGLPMMITVVLSSNMKRMLRDNVLVRKLVGIETSGSMNILFTDKTGTLTGGRLKAAFLLDGEGAELTAEQAYRRREFWTMLFPAIALNCSAVMSSKKGVAAGGNATDRAVLEFVCQKPGGTKKLDAVNRIPFSSELKFSASHVTGDFSKTFIKGAPDLLLTHCSSYLGADGRLSPLDRKRIESEIARLSGSAYRLIAVCMSDFPVTPQGNFRELTLIGLLAIRDEVRPEAKKGVREAQSAGIQVVMITGDSADTARAIAKEVGIIRRDADLALTSAQFSGMSDAQVLKSLPSLRVLARATPADKSRLVRLSQEAGLVAGMTGDGINDAPALKAADIGFAMGSGTEVAKEAGDIVILDNNFASIANAVRYGRTIFKSIRKFIIFQLSVNLCAVGLSCVGPFIGVESPVTIIQMLWVNLVMDTLAGLAFGGEPPLRDYMSEMPKRRDEPIINKYMIGEILFTGSYTALLCVWFLKSPFAHSLFRESSGDIVFMTAFFTMFMFLGVFNSFNARTHRLNLCAHIWRNKAFILIMCLVITIQLTMIYFGGSFLRTTVLLPGETLCALLLALTVVPVDLFRKIFLRTCGKRGGV